MCLGEREEEGIKVQCVIREERWNGLEMCMGRRRGKEKNFVGGGGGGMRERKGGRGNLICCYSIINEIHVAVHYVSV